MDGLHSLVGLYVARTASKLPAGETAGSPEEGQMVTKEIDTNSEVTGEPALWLGLASSAVQLAAAFFLPWPDETTAIVNAGVAALFGVWVAFRTKADDNGGSIKAAILGGAQALINIALVFGWHASDKQTSALLLVVTMACAAFIRQTSKPRAAQEAGVHADRPVSKM